MTTEGALRSERAEPPYFSVSRFTTEGIRVDLIASATTGRLKVAAAKSINTTKVLGDSYWHFSRNATVFLVVKLSKHFLFFLHFFIIKHSHSTI